MLQSFVQAGPVSVTRDSSVDTKGQFSLTCFCAGEAGKAYSKLPQADRRPSLTRSRPHWVRICPLVVSPSLWGMKSTSGRATSGPRAARARPRHRAP